MTSASDAFRAGPGKVSEDRSALFSAVGAYGLWGLLSLYFLMLGKAGAGPWEITAHRCLWSLPFAALLLWLSGRHGETLAVLRNARTLAWLAGSAALVSVNWALFIYASVAGHKLEASLAYYINPLLNMAAGAVLFRERFSRAGAIAIGLTAAGVLLQGLAVGHAPWLALGMAGTFGAYAVIRKRVAASARAGLFVETLILAPPGLAYVLWLAAHGNGRFGANLGLDAVLVLLGLVTVVPLSLFAFAARKLPLSTMGFLQFLMPTMTFVIAMATGEPMTPLRALSFAFIWGGVAVFIFGARQANPPQ